MLKRFLFSKTGVLVSTTAFILFTALVLPWFSQLSVTMTHTSFSPDTDMFYSAETFSENMRLYGPSGRRFYILSRWTFDVLWPVVYACFLISLIGYLSPELNRTQRRGVMVVPILGVLFDLLENTLATVNVALYPDLIPFLLRLLQGASLLKWMFIALSFLIILSLTALHINRRFKPTGNSDYHYPK